MKVGVGFHLGLRSPFGRINTVALSMSEGVLTRFLEEYATHEITKPPKGKKNWPALLVALHKKAIGKGRPLDAAADSRVQRATIDYKAHSIEIRKIDGKYEPIIGREFDRVKENLLKREWTQDQMKNLNEIIQFIEDGLKYKREKYRQILARQKKFLDTGDILDIQRGGLNEVAQELGIHYSSVSRLLAGVKFYLGRRKLDSHHLVPGSSFNQIVVPVMVRRVVRQRGGRLTHDELARLLNEKYPGMMQTPTGLIARRTVANLLPKRRRRPSR